MNSGLYFLVALALPMLICCNDFRSVSLDINQAAKRRSEVNLVAHTINDDFLTKVQICIGKIAQTDYYTQCLKDEAAKLKGINGTSDPKLGCCARVINYICLKSFLTPKCNVTKEEVESHDEEHFNFWNDLEVPNLPNHCSGGKQKSVDYCHSDNSVLTIINFGLVNLRINKAAKRIAKVNLVDRTMYEEFATKVLNCMTKISQLDYYTQCLKDESTKLKGITPNSPKFSCCARVINYVCMKSFLTPKCNVPKEEVENHDEEHFKLWNNIDSPGYPYHCSDGSQKSINYCHSNSTKTL